MPLHYRFGMPVLSDAHQNPGSRRYRHAAAPIGAAMEILPNILDLMRIAADQAGNDVIAEVAGNCELTAVERCVAESGYAVFCLYFQRDEVARGAGDDHERACQRSGGLGSLDAAVGIARASCRISECQSR